MSEKPALRVRIAIRSDRRFKQVIGGLRVAHQGFWLGMLDGRLLAEANEAAYNQWERFKDFEFNTSGLSDWEREAAQRYFPAGSSVLVPSAGAGREVIGLRELGYDASGFDPSRSLVEIGERLLEGQLRESALRVSCPDKVPTELDGPFDAILFGWGSYIHINGRDTRVAFLSDLRGLVDVGAPMILSFFLRSPGDRTFPATKALATAIRRIRLSREPVELGDTVAGTFDHYFTWDEIESELADAGFSVVATSSAPYPHLVSRAI